MKVERRLLRVERAEMGRKNGKTKTNFVEKCHNGLKNPTLKSYSHVEQKFMERKKIESHLKISTYC